MYIQVSVLWKCIVDSACLGKSQQLAVLAAAPVNWAAGTGELNILPAHIGAELFTPLGSCTCQYSSPGLMSLQQCCTECNYSTLCFFKTAAPCTKSALLNAG